MFLHRFYCFIKNLNLSKFVNNRKSGGVDLLVKGISLLLDGVANFHEHHSLGQLWLITMSTFPRSIVAIFHEHHS